MVDYTVKNSENLEGISCENKNVGAVWLIGCGAALRVRRGSQGAAWLIGCGAVTGRGAAHTVARLLFVRQARVRISARHPSRGGPLLSGSHEDIKRVQRRVVYINIVCLIN
jgi:hypothetical protein